MRAIVGLGNPGRKYQKTRHNIGFIIIDSLLDNYKIPLKAGKGDYYYAEVSENDKRLLVIKPTTYMNRSGLAVCQILKYFPLSIEDLLIVYDDFNLPLGTMRFRQSGGDGGHNGIKSIIYNLKTEDLSPEELSRLMTAIDEEEDIHVKNIMKMALFTGMRRGELFKLQWDDIDFERGFILIRDPKGGANQTIPLNNLTRQVLQNHPRTDSPFVFPGRAGKQRVDVKKKANKIK